MKRMLRLMAFCCATHVATPVHADISETPLLASATFSSESSAASIINKIQALGPLDLTVNGSPELGLVIAPGDTLTVDEFATVLSAALDDTVLAAEFLDNAVYASFTLLEDAKGTRIQLLVARPRSADEDRRVFQKIFGTEAPEGFQMIHIGVGSSGQHVFRLDRAWQTTATELTTQLKANGYLVHQMPGPSDTLVFAERADRALVLFIQHDPNGGATRVVVNLQE